MHIGFPQGIYLALTLIYLGIALSRDGELKGERYNFGASLFSTVIVLAILYWGGFFNPN